MCGAQGVCANTLGSYTCACQPGYRGNGTHCQGKQLAVTFHGIQMAAPRTPLRSIREEAGRVSGGGLLFPPGTRPHVFFRPVPFVVVATWINNPCASTCEFACFEASNPEENNPQK